jgi:hypothetical protein
VEHIQRTVDSYSVTAPDAPVGIAIGGRHEHGRLSAGGTVAVAACGGGDQ